MHLSDRFQDDNDTNDGSDDNDDVQYLNDFLDDHCKEDEEYDCVFHEDDIANVRLSEQGAIEETFHSAMSLLPSLDIVDHHDDDEDDDGDDPIGNAVADSGEIYGYGEGESLVSFVPSHPFPQDLFAPYFHSGRFSDYYIRIESHRGGETCRKVPVHRIVLDHFDFFRPDDNGTSDHIVIKCHTAEGKVGCQEEVECARSECVWHSVIEFLYTGNMPSLEEDEESADECRREWFWFGLLQAAHTARLERLFELVAIHFLEHVHDHRVSLVSLGLDMEAPDSRLEGSPSLTTGNDVQQMQKSRHVQWFAMWLRRFRKFDYMTPLTTSMERVLRKCPPEELEACNIDAQDLSFRGHVASTK